jgi:hypothetical protein
MLKNFVRLFAVCTCLLAAVIPSTASAAGGGGGGTPGAITITIDPTIYLSDRQILTGTVTTTCPELDQYPGGPPVTSYYPNGYLSVQEVVGNQIAHAGLGSWTTVCDGVPRTYTLTGLAWDHPFHPGSGVASAWEGQVCGYDPVSAAYMCVEGAATQPVSIVVTH